MKHYSKRYIWYLMTFSIFWSVVIATTSFSSIFVGDSEEVVLEAIYFFYLLGIYLFVQIISIVYIILKWRYTTYTLTEDAIKLNKGIIFKQKKTLPYNKIHAIDYKQNILEKIFGIKKLSIDSGATMTADLAEIVIIEKNKIVDNLIKEVRLKMGSDVDKDEDDNFYVFSLKYKFIDSLLKTLIVSIFAAIGTGILLSFVYYYGEKQSKDQILSFIIIVLIVITILFIGHFLSTVIRYYNYKVIIQNKELIISYGIFKKINNTLPLNKIKAIKIEEGLIQRIFKVCSIKLELVGFGNYSENVVSNFYIPFCFKKDVSNYINILNLDFKYYEATKKSPRRGFRYFYSLPIMIFSLVYAAFFPFLIVFSNALPFYLGGYILILIIIFLASLLNYKNAGLYFDDKQVIIYNGSFIKRSTIILNENITGIEKVNTYCRSKKEIASFHIHYYNNAMKNVEVANLLDKNIFDDLIKIIRY